MVDWTAPIEIVHTDGRIVPATFMHVSRDGNHSWMTHESPDDGISNIHWHEDGRDFRLNSGWRIRNVGSEPPTTTIPTALYERMVGLVRDMVRQPEVCQVQWQHTAREIAKELPVEVKTDSEHAQEIMPKELYSPSWDAVCAWVEAGIAKGRQLERGE